MIKDILKELDANPDLIENETPEPNSTIISNTAREIGRDISDAVSIVGPSTTNEIMGGRYRLDSYEANNIDYKIVKDVSDFYRHTFYNSRDHGWGQYAFCPDCNVRSSASDVYPNEDGVVGDVSYDVPLDLIDSNPILPDCPCCSNKMRLYITPERAIKMFIRKMSKQAWITLLRDQTAGDKLAGLVLNYQRPLRELFTMEEWEYPYLYSDFTEEEHTPHIRSFDNFRVQVTKYAIDQITKRGNVFENLKFDDDNLLSPDTPVNSANCVILARNARGGGNYYTLTGTFLDFLPEKDANVLALGETVIGNAHSTILFSCGAEKIPGVLEDMSAILENGHSTLIGYRMSDLKKAFARAKSRI